MTLEAEESHYVQFSVPIKLPVQNKTALQLGDKDKVEEEPCNLSITINPQKLSFSSEYTKGRF